MEPDKFSSSGLYWLCKEAENRSSAAGSPATAELPHPTKTTATIGEAPDSQLREAPVAAAANAEVGGAVGEKRRRGRPPKNEAAKRRKKKEDEDVCFICFDGGSLVLCDRGDCPKAYHPACIKRDESFFQSKAKWTCGWHICSKCQKPAHYMCYTCTYSLCKGCTKDADYLCVRGNKGFCSTCMPVIMLIEKIDQGNRETVQVDFDDKTSWEYLFKVYWVCLKRDLSLTLDELTRAQNPWRVPSKATARQKSSAVYVVGNNGTLTKEQSTLPNKGNSYTAVQAGGHNNNTSVISTAWASKELLDFVSHMRNGDTSALSQKEVQALLFDHIKRNNLRDPHQRSEIICDSKLVCLFGKPRVRHFEMLSLLEFHFLTKDDSQRDEIEGVILDPVVRQVEGESNGDNLPMIGENYGHKARKKDEEKVDLNLGTGGEDSREKPQDHVDSSGSTNNGPKNQTCLKSGSPSGVKSETSVASLSTGSTPAANDTETENSWQYRDPNGKVQGPFGIVQLHKWSETGIFPPDLKIWTLNNEECNAVLLTDVLKGQVSLQSNLSLSPQEFKGTPDSTSHHSDRQWSGTISCNGLDIDSHSNDKGNRPVPHSSDWMNPAMNNDSQIENSPKHWLPDPPKVNHPNSNKPQVHLEKSSAFIERPHKTSLRKKRNSEQAHESSLHQERNSERPHETSLRQKRNSEQAHETSLHQERNSEQPHETSTREERNSEQACETYLHQKRTSEQPHETSKREERNSEQVHETYLHQKRISEQPHHPHVTSTHEGRVSEQTHEPYLHQKRISEQPHEISKREERNSEQAHETSLHQKRISEQPHESSLRQERNSEQAHELSLLQERKSEHGHETSLHQEKKNVTHAWNAAANYEHWGSQGNTSSHAINGPSHQNQINKDRLYLSQPSAEGPLPQNGSANSWNSHQSHPGPSHENQIDKDRLYLGQPSAEGPLPQNGSANSWNSHQSHPGPSHENQINKDRLYLGQPSAEGPLPQNSSANSWNSHQSHSQYASMANLTISSEQKFCIDLQSFPMPNTSTGEELQAQTIKEQQWQPPQVSVPDLCFQNVLSLTPKSIDIDERADFRNFKMASLTNNDEKVEATKNKHPLSTNSLAQDFDHNWGSASSLDLGVGTQHSKKATKSFLEEWDPSFLSVSSLRPHEVANDHGATRTSKCDELFPPSPPNPVPNAPSWLAMVTEPIESTEPMEPIEFATLAEESVSDLLAEVDAMESHSDLASPNMVMDYGDELFHDSKTDCFTSLRGLSSPLDRGKNGAVSSSGEIQLPPQTTMREQLPPQITMREQLPPQTTMREQLPPQSFMRDEPIRAPNNDDSDSSKRSRKDSSTSSAMEVETKRFDFSDNLCESRPNRPHLSPPKKTRDLADIMNAPVADARHVDPVRGTKHGNLNSPGSTRRDQGTARGNGSKNRSTTGGVSGRESHQKHAGERLNNSPRDRNVPNGVTSPRDGKGRQSWSRQSSFGGGGGGGSSNNHSRSLPRGQRVCKFYENGYCRKGAFCDYLHP